METNEAKRIRELEALLAEAEKMLPYVRDAFDPTPLLKKIRETRQPVDFWEPSK